MTTLLDVSAGRIVLRNVAGDTVFDSDQKLFQATSQETGTKVVGPWTASFDQPTATFTDVNTDTLHELKTVNGNCDTVVGAFKVSVPSGSYGVSGVGWFNASGTYLHFLNSSIGTRTIAQNMAAFTFEASGGKLYLRERVILRAAGGLGSPSNSITLLQTTFEYNLYVGSFV